MKKTLLEDLKTGMKLAKDVNGSQGKLLLKKDIELNEKHIRILKTWGINSVFTYAPLEDNDTDKTIEQITPEQLNASIQKVLPLFKHNDVNHPLIKYLLEHRAKYELLKKD